MPVTWITEQDVVDYVGSSVALDDPWLVSSTAAANEWGRRRRLEAGYLTDVDDTVPGPDVAAGVTMYAGALFRARGAADGFASFEDFAERTGSLGAGWTQIKQLLGIGRPVAV